MIVWILFATTLGSADKFAVGRYATEQECRAAASVMWNQGDRSETECEMVWVR
jgi:hypothetical protein